MKYAFDQRQIEGDVTNTIVLTQDGDSVWFDCGPLKIEGITTNKTPATYRLQGEKLVVHLPERMRKGSKLAVRIRYSGQPTAGIYFVGAAHAYPGHTSMVYTQGEAEDTRYWLPTYDFPDDKATAEAFITVPAGEYALSNGKLMKIDKQKDAWTYHWRISRPMSTYLISLVAGEYSEGKEFLGKLPVSWFTPVGTETWGVAAFAGTDKNIDFYNRLTGFNYPYEKFSQSAVADFMFGGMENTTCVTQTITALHKPENKPIADSTGLVAHELAHQWFGDTVTCADWSHAWLNEGFATFLPVFYMKKLHGQAAYDLGRFDLFSGAVASQEFTKRPVVNPKYEIPMDNFDGQIYGGGAARLFTLMGQVGEKPFWTAVNRYLNTYKFKNATTEQFFEVMSQSTGMNLDAFRKQFFYTDGYPNFRVAKEGSTVVIRQSEPYFDLNLKLSMLDRNEVVKEIPVSIHGSETRVDIKGYEKNIPVLDYAVTAMAKITYSDPISSPELLRIWWLAPNAAAKMMVLGRFGDKVNQTDLLDVARDEKSPEVLINVLDRLTSEDAVPLLADLSRNFDRQVAYKATQRLGEFPKNQQAQDRLAEIWRNEKNEYIRNVALTALLRTAKDGSLAAEAWRTESEKEMFRQSALWWWTEHDPDLARMRDIEVLTAPVEPLNLSAIRSLGRLKDKPGLRTVYKELIRIAGGRSFAQRTAAVEALVEYGDPAAIPTIEPLTKSSLFFLRRTGEAAIEALKKKITKEGPTKAAPAKD